MSSTDGRVLLRAEQAGGWICASFVRERDAMAGWHGAEGTLLGYGGADGGAGRMDASQSGEGWRCRGGLRGPGQYSRPQLKKPRLLKDMGFGLVPEVVKWLDP